MHEDSVYVIYHIPTLGLFVYTAELSRHLTGHHSVLLCFLSFVLYWNSFTH
jgi:hypothetical protein